MLRIHILYVIFFSKTHSEDGGERAVLPFFALVAQRCCSWQCALLLQLRSSLMVKQHAHAMLSNDRLDLFHWSGAFESQWRAHTVRRCAARQTFERARMHVYQQSLKRTSATQRASACTDFCGDWWMQSEVTAIISTQASHEALSLSNLESFLWAQLIVLFLNLRT